MDLNASPLPEEDEETFERNLEATTVSSDHVESAVDILRREREERRNRLKRERADDKPSYTTPNHKPKDGQNHRFYDSSRLPPGWLDCPAYGNEIFGIIPSKVPLGESFNDSITPGNRYSFKQVIHQQRVLGRKIGLVIDLTNTTRYYPASDLNKEGIKHVKLQCKGRDSVPDNESVNSFVHEVSQFLFRQKQQKRFVLVHCTHGHNRTGFMIVHYLMRTMGISVTQALNCFYEARPPGIYKSDYIDALYAFYHERKPDGLIPPSTPEWKRSSDFDLNGDAKAEDYGLGTTPVLEIQEADILMTNDDVLGDAIPFDQQDTLRVLCYQMLFGAGFALPRGKNQFPGSHPVSLNRDNLQLLRQRYYYATWKADGTRYMMLITTDGCYLIDRNFCFRRVQMRFPCRNTNEGTFERTHHFTLLDGEMIIDTLPDSSKDRRYLIYDLMALNQVPVIERPFYERWKLLDKEVIDPRKNDAARNPYYRYDLEPFRVRRKNFWLLSAVNKLLKEFIANLSHGADGLIFQGWDDPYIPRTHEGLLKWKYPEMNSVDFLFEVVEEDKFLLYLFDRGRKLLMEGNHVVFPETLEPLSLSGKIVECAWDGEREVWYCMRVRTDKSTPNEISTYKKVLRSIKDNITEDILQNEIEEILCFPMYVERIKMDSRAHQQSNPPKKKSDATSLQT